MAIRHVWSARTPVSVLVACVLAVLALVAVESALLSVHPRPAAAESQSRPTLPVTASTMGGSSSGTSVVGSGPRPGETAGAARYSVAAGWLPRHASLVILILILLFSAGVALVVRAGSRRDRRRRR